MVKCRWCDKKFEPHSYNQLYCSEECRNEAEKFERRVVKFVNTVAKRENLIINEKNKKNIVRAKIMFFKKGNFARCPCDADNKNRYCCSPTCKADIEKDGHCHCNLFLRNNESLTSDGNDID